MPVRISHVLVGALLTAALCVGCAAPHGTTSVPPIARKKPVLTRNDEAINAMIAKMALEEKVELLGGTGFATKPNTRLGIPAMNMADGPHGIRWGEATCFPTGVAMGATWDEGLIHAVGQALARELKGKGRHVLLGPCINIHRVPHGGRNFESFSEDPYLTARLAVAYVQGVQREGVVACPKHFACNNQELERTTIDAKVDERAMREIYLPAFKAVVQEAGAASVMAAYNRVNGPYACASKRLLTDILKDEWGFEGLVMSDWNAVHSTVPTANAGLDLEMPRASHLGEALLEAIGAGSVSETTIDDKVRRILRTMHFAGLFNPQPEAHNADDSTRHRRLARDVARSAIVLLKNNNSLLPLDRDKVRSIAVIGPNAHQARLGGGGSSTVKPSRSVSPLKGITTQSGGRIRIRHAQGCPMPGDLPPIPAQFLSPPKSEKGEGLRAEYFANKNLEGKPAVIRRDATIDFDWDGASPAGGIKKDGFAVRWTGQLEVPESGEYELAAISDDGSRLYLDGELLIDNWRDQGRHAQQQTVELEAGRPYDIKFEYYENGGAAVVRLGWSRPGDDTFEQAIEAATDADVAVIFAGLSSRFEGEGVDKKDLNLPGRQPELIRAVLSANPNTVVVLIGGTPMITRDWHDLVPAILHAWYPGQEGGTAIAEVLFGDVNPSGKLPVSLPNAWEDASAFGNYPGQNGQVYFGEGLFTGYRHFDANRVQPAFPFGHGLSYTQFTYSDLKIEPTAEQTVRVSLKVENTGRKPGREVVQLYVCDLDVRLERPVKELKAFQSVALNPDQSSEVSFDLDRGSLSFYDPRQAAWVAEPGRFRILVGSSSRDIRLRGDFTLAE